MSHDARCRSCGHVLGIGRFCVNCGHPKDDHVAASAEGLTSPSPPPRSRPAGAAEDPADRRRPLRRRSAAPWWVAAAVALVVLAGAGGFILLSGDGEDAAVDEPPAAISVQPDAPSITVPPVPASPSTSPDDPPDPGPSGSSGPVDVSRLAEAVAPDTAAPSRDVRGNAVRYEAAYMLDGQPDTAWRMPGDATGREVLFRLDSPTTISAVGLVNGYAKIEPGYDGYAANRRITAVEWVFDDGTVVPQSLAEEPTMQGVEVDDVTTSAITLRIVAVTEPARGRAGRDYTAISDVAFAGVPA